MCSEHLHRRVEREDRQLVVCTFRCAPSSCVLSHLDEDDDERGRSPAAAATAEPACVSCKRGWWGHDCLLNLPLPTGAATAVAACLTRRMVSNTTDCALLGPAARHWGPMFAFPPPPRTGGFINFCAGEPTEPVQHAVRFGGLLPHNSQSQVYTRGKFVTTNRAPLRGNPSAA